MRNSNNISDIDLPVKPIHRDTVPEKVIHQIKSLIDEGYLMPGGKLPAERELARQLGVSRPSLREALGALALLGVVVHYPGKGTFLSESIETWPSEPFRLLMSVKKSAILYIFEARKSLEGTVAALASERCSGDDLHALKKDLVAMKSNLDQPEKYDHFELKFHKDLIDVAGNPVIADIMERLYRLLSEKRKGLARYGSSDKRRQDYLMHEKIFEAVKSRDKEMATMSMLNHLIQFENRLRTEIKDSPQKV